MSALCAYGRINWAMEGGVDEGAIYRDDREGGVGTAKWGGDGCNHSSRIGGVRWWQVLLMK